MPYFTPPTFLPDAVLEAAQLNILSNDIEYINSLTDYLNLPFFRYVYGVGDAQDMSTQKWMFRHRHRYLHYYLTIDTEDLGGTLRIYIDWTGSPVEVFTRTTGLTAPETITGYIDLDPYVVTDGAWMQVYWSAVSNGLSTAHYFLESSFTSI